MTAYKFNPFRNHAVAMFLFILFFTAVSCNLPSGLASTPTPQPPTNTPLPPANSPTPEPPTATFTPTMTFTPTSTTTPAPINIVFFAGTTAAVEQGTIQHNQVITYTLSAGQAQPMILILSSAHNDAYLGVSEPNGTMLLDPAKKWSNWQWILPKTEVYSIQVYGGTTPEDFTLTAKVAQLVSFSSGSNTLTLNGSTPKGFVISYSITCSVGQVMTAGLNVPSTTAYMDIFGIATGPLLNASSKANTWTGTLPSTQAYVIEVIPAAGNVVSFTLKVKCQ